MEVVVKPLEWSPYGYARTPFGAYEVLELDGEWRLYIGMHRDHMVRIGPPHLTEDAAKAAAQPDFEMRIRLALAMPDSTS